MKKLARGKTLEKDVNKVNLRYRREGLALIMKNPVPMAITSRGIIPSSAIVDWSGVIKGGRFCAIEGKQTKEKSLPLASIKEHQVEYLRMTDNLGGLAYLLVCFTAFGDHYLIPARIVTDYWDKAKVSGRKSIPRTELSEYKAEINDYLNLNNHN